MKYKATCSIPGEPRVRQVFGDVYGVVSGWVSRTLADPSVPEGTEVRVYEVEEKLRGTYVKKGKGEEGKSA